MSSLPTTKVTSLPETKKNTQRLAVLRATVAQGATDEEFAMFLEICKATKLNPFKREIWFIKTKGYQNKQGRDVAGQVQIMTGFNGFLAIANGHPQFDGMTTELLRRPDMTIEAATATVYRKDRKVPISCTVYMKEFYKPGFNGRESQWDKQPAVMLLKVAKSHALRESFTQELGGLYSQEEVGESEPKVTFEEAAELSLEKDHEIADGDIDAVMEKINLGEK